MLAKIFVVLLLIDAFVLMAAILLQSGKGGGLAASFGGSSSGDQLFGARQAGNLLTKVTWWGAGIFLGLAFIMQLMSARTSAPTSILDSSLTPAAPTAPAAGTGAAPNLLPTTPADSAGTTKKQP